MSAIDRNRREAVIADRGCGRDSWAGSGPSLAMPVGPESALTRRSYSCSDLVGDRPATIGIGAKVVGHARHVAFQMAEIAIPRQMFQEILRLIAELRPKPPPAPA